MNKGARISPRRSHTSGAAGSGGKPVTLKMLSAHLGISQGVISLVLNAAPGSKAIPPATQERIHTAAAELNYRPNYFARYLSSGRSYMIGVLVTSLREGYDSALLAGIELRLIDSPYVYLAASHLWSPAIVERTFQTLTERGAEGLILINTEPPARKVTIPIVRVGAGQRNPALYGISVDNGAAAKLALSHLYDLGHRRIAFFRGHADSLDSESRWQGLRLAAREFGLRIDPDLVVQLSRHKKTELGGTEEGSQAAKILLDRGKNFTALIAFNDISAVGAISALQDAGRAVPQDISVVGFDDISLAELTRPRLTTIRQPLLSMGELAATTLLAAIGQERTVPDAVLMAPSLVVRETTGCVKR